MDIYSQGEIFAVFDKPIYAPGDTVEGIAVFEIMGALPRSVHLSVDGHESCGIKKSQLEGGRRFMKSEEIILNYGTDIVSPGSYAVPFSFKIPSGVPDSFRFEKDNGAIEAEIEYRVYILYMYKDETTFELRSRSSSFVVRNPIPPADRIAKAVVDEPCDHDIMTCCCFKTGGVSADLSLNKSAYFPGETVKFRAVIRQSKPGKIRKLEADFGYMIQVSKTSLFSDYIMYPEEAESVTIATPAITFDRKSKDKETVVEFEVKVPEDAEPSSMGAITRRFHFIRLKADTPSSFFTHFGICVNVLPKSDPDFSVRYPQTLLNRVKERVATTLVVLPKLEWKLPGHVNLDGTPLGSMEKFILPQI